MRLENFQQRFCGNLIPLLRNPFWGTQRRMPVVPVQLRERLLTIRARLALVPLAQHIPHQAMLRVRVHLAQTFLPAILPFP
jgi:hypothetical protein